MLNQLYASSRLQESYSANMMAIVDGRPVLMTLLTCSTFTWRTVSK